MGDLPVNQQQVPQAAQPAQGQLPHLLIVEDDLSLAKMYATKFAKEGFRVTEAHDGETGLTMAAQLKPAVILLDMMLPKYSGIEFLEQLQQHTQMSSTIIIALTNLTEKQESDRAFKLGVKDYLAKAMHTPEEVVAKVKEHLAKVPAPTGALLPTQPHGE